jgi:hypothetical protein
MSAYRAEAEVADVRWLYLDFLATLAATAPPRSDLNAGSPTRFARHKTLTDIEYELEPAVEALI